MNLTYEQLLESPDSIKKFVAWVGQGFNIHRADGSLIVARLDALTMENPESPKFMIYSNIGKIELKPGDKIFAVKTF